MKTTTVVEFSKKEIQDILLAEAKRQLGINGQQTSRFEVDITPCDASKADLNGISITFDNLVPKSKT